MSRHCRCQLNQRKKLKSFKIEKRDKNTLNARDGKGNTVIIMDSAHYQNKINTFLIDTNNYKEIKTDPTDKYTQQLRKELENLKDNRLITPQMFRRLCPKGCSAPKFNDSPNIHKNDTPLRPIVACNSSPATGVGKFLATIFKPLLTT